MPTGDFQRLSPLVLMSNLPRVSVPIKTKRYGEPGTPLHKLWATYGVLPAGLTPAPLTPGCASPEWILSFFVCSITMRAWELTDGS
jgi:hypothetical protein